MLDLIWIYADLVTVETLNGARVHAAVIQWGNGIGQMTQIVYLSWLICTCDVCLQQKQVFSQHCSQEYVSSQKKLVP